MDTVTTVQLVGIAVMFGIGLIAGLLS